jgi:hypothetical protein
MSMTPSGNHWFRKLAGARYANGRWVLSDQNQWRQDPFESLREDLTEAVGQYNQFAADNKIKILGPPKGSDVIAVMIAGQAQIQFVRKNNFLDLIMIKTVNFQSNARPLARFSAAEDPLSEIVWRRGSAETSNEQMIRNAVMQLLENAFAAS